MFTLFLLLAITWHFLDKKYSWCTDLGAFSAMVLCGIVFIVNSIMLAVSPSNTSSEIRSFEAVRLTITQQRNNKLTELERATITKEIIDNNAWLAKEQFWAKNSWLNWYYDKKIINIKPIE